MNKSQNPLVKLYNAIKQDYSIQRYSLGWSDVTTAIEKKFKTIETSSETFSDEVLKSAILIAKGGLKTKLEVFAKELNINLETIRSK